MNRPAVGHYCIRRQQRARGLVHKWHEFVGKAGHRTADTDAANIGTSSNATHPSPFAHIALHHRTPTAELHNAEWRTILFSELPLFVISAPVASLVHCRSKQPGGSQTRIQRDHGG